MSYYNDPQIEPAIQFGRLPWLMFLFIASVFFLVYHDPSISKRGLDNYNLSEDDIVANVAEGSPVHRIALLSLGVFAIVSLSRYRANGRLRIHGFLGWILLCFTAWALLSLLWAEDIGLTLRRLAVFGITGLAALAVARCLSLREMIFWTFFTTGLYLVIGFSAEIFLGTFRPFLSGYRFAGTLDPNNQGVNCTLLLLSAVTAANLERRRQTLYRACALVAFVFLILTASRTSFAAALVALAVYLGTVCSKATKTAMAYAFIVVFCVLLLILGNTVLSGLKSAVMLGRDDSSAEGFNGRSGIWEGVTYYVYQRPILGYGYGGFWTPTHISVISDEEKWGVPNGHSAYLDYLLTLGVVGLVGYALLVVGGIARAFRFWKLSRDPAFAFCGAILVFCALDGFLESAVIDPPSFLLFINWIVLGSLALKDGSQADRVLSRRGSRIVMKPDLRSYIDVKHA